jgi:hypothetical protein
VSWNRVESSISAGELFEPEFAIGSGCHSIMGLVDRMYNHCLSFGVF